MRYCGGGGLREEGVLQSKTVNEVHGERDCTTPGVLQVRRSYAGGVVRSYASYVGGKIR